MFEEEKKKKRSTIPYKSQVRIENLILSLRNAKKESKQQNNHHTFAAAVDTRTHSQNRHSVSQEKSKNNCTQLLNCKLICSSNNTQHSYNQTHQKQQQSTTFVGQAKPN